MYVQAQAWELRRSCGLRLTLTTDATIIRSRLGIVALSVKCPKRIANGMPKVENRKI